MFYLDRIEKAHGKRHELFFDANAGLAFDHARDNWNFYQVALISLVRAIQRIEPDEDTNAECRSDCGDDA